MRCDPCAFAAFYLVLAIVHLNAFAEIKPATDSPAPLSPAESAKTFRLPPGFRAELIASEPLINEPSGVCWDEQGRLFVSELHGYNVDGWYDIQELNKTGQLDTSVRRIRGSKEGRERAKAETYGVVKLLLDRDGDGRMDDAILWATNLPPCYGVVPARGGIIAVGSPDIVFLADTNGDNVPDVRETLFTGFNVGEIERGINAPQWGVDNWIYVGAGWGGSTVTGPHLNGSVQLGHTDFRFRPDGSALEPVEGETGTFGHAMTLGGERFFTETSRPARYALPIPWRYLGRNPDAAMPRVTQDAASDNRTYPISPVHPWRLKRGQDPAWVKFYGAEETTPQGVFTSACSPLIYQDVAWPVEYRGQLLVCDPAQNLVSNWRIEDDGPGFRVRRAAEKAEFLAAADSWFRPMFLAHAPDGAVWVVDMYREFIEDFSAIPRFLQQQYNVLNGRDRGRLWRITHEAAPKGPSVNMAKLSDAQLAEEIASPHYWRRQTARRLLIERKARDSASAVSALLGQTAVAANTAVNALYTLEGLDALREGDLLTALAHPSSDVRRHVLRLADQHFDGVGKAVEKRLLAGDVRSFGTEPRLLLQMALSLGESRDPQATSVLTKLAREHGDLRWMDAAIASSAHRREKEMLAALVVDSGHAGVLLEPLVAAVAARGDEAEIVAAKEVVAKAADAEQGKLFTRILEAGLAEATAKPDAVTKIDPPQAPSAEFLAGIEKLVPKYVAALSGRRDVARGRELFREHCAACHIAKGLGVAVGPNLDSEQLRAEETILRDILLPNETIRPGYETYQVETRRGDSYQGILASESPTSLTLRLPSGDELTVLRKRVTRSRAYKVSLMPASHYQVLGPQDVADIVAFLRGQ
jgi:putative membrane-bound dehydrogenase-like protein